jgi:MFS family permease
MPDPGRSDEAVDVVSQAARVAQPVPPNLRRNADFLRMWAGQSLSLIGTQATLVALPLVAVVIVQASTAQLGLLGALGRLPYLGILFVGVWADRARRRPLLVASDLGRGLLLLSIPVLYLTGDLSIEVLFAVILGTGALSVVFDVAWAAYLPALVPRTDLPEANSKLQLSAATADLAGPGIVALLLRWFSAATVLFVDAVSYVVSAVLCLLIRTPEVRPERPAPTDRSVLAAIRSGLRWVWHQPLLRPTLLSTACLMFFMPGIQALYFPYAYRTLGVPASWIAAVLTLGAPGAMLGSALGPRLVRRLGLGRMCVIAALGGNTSYLLIPLATRPVWLAVALLGAAQLIFGFTMPLGIISTMTIRQAVTPDELQGRVAATFRAFGFGMAPLGALAAGFAGTVLGLRTAILVGAIGALVPILILFFSPLPALRDVPGGANR